LRVARAERFVKELQVRHRFVTFGLSDASVEMYDGTFAARMSSLGPAGLA